MVKADYRTTQVTAPTTGTLPVRQSITIGALGSALPKAVFVEICSATSVSVTPVGGARIGMGFCDGTRMRAWALVASNGDATPNSGIRIDNATLIQFCDAAVQTLNAEARWDQWVAGGMEILWDDLPDATYVLTVTYYYGDDVEAFIADVTGAASDGGTAVVSTCPFPPNFGMWLGANTTVQQADFSGVNARMNFGLACKAPDGSILQGGVTVFDRNAPTVNTSGACVIRNDALCQLVTAANTGTLTSGARLAVTSWNPDGVTLTTQGGSDAMSGSIMLLRLSSNPQWIGTVTVNSDTTGSHVVTECPIKGKSLTAVGWSQSAVNSPTAGNAASHVSVGFVSPTGEACAGIQIQDSTAPSVTRSVANSTLIQVVDDDGTDMWRAAFTSFDDPTGFTINIADAAASDLLALFHVLGVDQFAPYAVFGEAARQHQFSQRLRM